MDSSTDPVLSSLFTLHLAATILADDFEELAREWRDGKVSRAVVADRLGEKADALDKFRAILQDTLGKALPDPEG